jgi:hypothetical protein
MDWAGPELNQQLRLLAEALELSITCRHRTCVSMVRTRNNSKGVSPDRGPAEGILVVPPALLPDDLLRRIIDDLLVPALVDKLLRNAQKDYCSRDHVQNRVHNGDSS